jgi:hypothetical protein
MNNIYLLYYMDNNIKNLIHMYDKLTYFDQYGGSLILFIIITIVVILLVSYFYTMINIQPIIDDWPNQRCNPTIMPFAGLITHPEGVSASDYTYQNFNYCTQNILSNITGYSVQPLTYITNILQSVTNLIKESIQQIRAMIDKIRSSMQAVTQEIMGRIMNVMIPLQQIIISFRDLIGKIQGTMTAGLFTLLGSYYTLKALMGAIAQFIITILIALAVMIAAFWIFPFTWGAAIANTVIFIAIAIPMSIILAFMIDILKVKTSLKIPKVKCFDINTPIQLNDGTFKQIIDINVGDKLKNNNEVTAKIKVSSADSEMYYLNGTIVSNSHIVEYKNKWIYISQHPKAVKFKCYNKPYLYCLNTTNKIIEINGITFNDWDDIYYNENFKKVTKNIPVTINKIKNIHKYLDYGFTEDTNIMLKNGRLVKICDININDILENGEKVYGVVQINCENLIDEGFNRYILGDNIFIDGFNININQCLDETNIVKMNYKPNKLYNLLTNKDTFKIHNIIFSDYNYAIDRFLEK